VKKWLLIMCIACVTSCKQKPVIFLGFELLSSEREYNKHRKDLINDKKIQTGNHDYYSMECGYSYRRDGFSITSGLFFEPHFTQDQLYELVLSTYFSPEMDEEYDPVTKKYIGVHVSDSTKILDEFNCIIETYARKYGRPTDTLGYYRGSEISSSNTTRSFVDTGYGWTLNNYKIVIIFQKEMFNFAKIRTVSPILPIYIIYSADWSTIDNKSGRKREQKERERTNDI